MKLALAFAALIDVASASRPPSIPEDGVVEIDFEPMGPPGGGLRTSPRDMQLNEVLDDMAAEMFSKRPGDDGPGPEGMGEGMPMSHLQDLFPPGQVIIEEDDGPPPILPSDVPPDLVLEDMMQEMDGDFRDQVLPMARSASGVQTSCSRELKAHCGGTQSAPPSQLHCLGKHGDDISKGCHDAVGKSVPFLCSDAIDRFCDVMMTGILPCLEAKIPQLEEYTLCRDAILATRKVITKINSQKASFTDPRTGKKKTSIPAAPQSRGQREANLDAKLRGLSTLSAEPRATPKPHLQEALLDVSLLHHAERTEQSQAHKGPPMAAILVPAFMLVVVAVIVYNRPPVYEPKQRFWSQHEDCSMPLTGTELMRPNMLS